jgi:hypothetical protein
MTFLTLEELLHQLNVATFCQISQKFGEVRAAAGTAIGQPRILEAVDPAMRKAVGDMCGSMFNSEARRYLPSAVDATARLQRESLREDLRLHELVELMGDVCRRLQDDLGRSLVLQIEPVLIGYGSLPLHGWELAIDAFPTIKNEVHESSLCLVFERWTASVFHDMRIMECGLDRLRTMVRVPKKRPGWDGIIEAIDGKLKSVPGAKKSPAARKRNRFIAEAVLLLRAVKESRNAAMHDFTKSYSQAQAIDLYRAVQSFMQKMAEVA